MSHPETLALVGAVGGAGTTRLAVEFAATLARTGRDVAVLDAAYATQGLAQYVPGRIDPDLTALCLTDDSLAAGLVDLPGDRAGRVALCPAFAPFERVARAKTPDAARRLEDRIEAAAGWFDHVVVDTPPVAANQAVAAVNAADRVALVTPATRRGLDALPRAHGRLADVGVEDRLVVANRTGSGGGTVDVEGEVGVDGNVAADADGDGAADVDGIGPIDGDVEVAAGVDPSGEAGRAGDGDTGDDRAPSASDAAPGPDAGGVGAGGGVGVDAVVAKSQFVAPAEAPAVVDEGPFGESVARAVETVLDVEIGGVSTEDSGLGRYLPL